jgi:predicted nucleic acid-binding protein
MSGEQQPRRSAPSRVIERTMNQLRVGCDKAGVGRVTTHSPGGHDHPYPRRLAPPPGERRSGRRRRELRVERQRHHPVGAEDLDLASRLLAHRMPVAHGDKHPDLAQVRQRGLEGVRLLSGALEKR